ncbi:FixH family protein [Sulfurirhabdus autotrophica]|uniref:FixH protein n=1 Tax=Sulfurirhabdus autotrophica TaxID=1706046 RepID=A0A4R3XY63_9PROT|nr:FixH family protein [Sulfurirhabdus autotrophica]TCV84745.1 FixH protein [Sulfurirhabdus autotrophica]
MTLLETLFGGLILVALLYFALKLFGVSNYWRGVVSGVFPIMAYIGYSMVQWPGGEVVSMHVAVYTATATVLTLLGSRKSKDNQPLHWIPKLITAFFVILFIIMANLMYIASRGVSPSIAKWLLPPAKHAGAGSNTAFPGVVAHEGDAAAAVNQHLKQLERQRKLGWQVELVGLEQLKQNQDHTIVVRLKDKQQAPVEAATVSLSLLRPATALEDQKSIAMPAIGGGVYQAVVKLQNFGRWVAVVDVSKGDDQFQVQKNVIVLKSE